MSLGASIPIVWRQVSAHFTIASHRLGQYLSADSGSVQFLWAAALDSFDGNGASL